MFVILWNQATILSATKNIDSHSKQVDIQFSTYKNQNQQIYQSNTGQQINWKI